MKKTAHWKISLLALLGLVFSGSAATAGEVFSPETTFFSYFIPLEWRWDSEHANEAPVPTQFVKEIKAHLDLAKRTGMRYVFATDFVVLSPQHREVLQTAARRLEFEVLDISTLPSYRPFYKRLPYFDYTCADSYRDVCVRPIAEYVDKVKLLLGNLAGLELNGKKVGNALVVDPDIEFRDDHLEVGDDVRIAFADSGKHVHPTTTFSVENSMIFVSSDRPSLPGLNGNRDLIQDFILPEIAQRIEHNPCRCSNSLYGSFVYSLSAHDSLLLLEGMDLGIHGSVLPGYRLLSHRPRVEAIQKITAQGKYILQGDYSSDNQSTWRAPHALKYPSFEEFLLGMGLQG